MPRGRHTGFSHPAITFLSHVETNGWDRKTCWPYTGAGKGNGYGNVRVGSGNQAAHARSYELFVGPVPEGMEVCHTCDNRWCVNPDHLFAGTRAHNMEDCRSKGRAAGGNRKHLTEERVQEVRRRLHAGASPRQIATAMDINYTTITSIAGGRAYGRISE